MLSWCVFAYMNGMTLEELIIFGMIFIDKLKEKLTYKNK
jgi:hypothetical protein